MGAQKEIERRIRKKEQEIADLERQLYQARAYLEAMQESLKVVSRHTGADMEDALRPGSMMYQAREALRLSGEPLHVDRILEIMGKTKEDKLSLSGSLAAYVRRGQIFTRPAPNTFGLREFEDGEELPETFGSTSGA